MQMLNEVLIVGLGMIGMGYDSNVSDSTVVRTHAKAFSLHPQFKVVAGVDRSASKRQQFLAQFQSPAYSTVDEALRLHSPNVVVIATPTETHRQVMEDVLKSSSVKVLLCEKPIANSIEDAEKMLEMCRARGIALFINYMRRVDPAVIDVERRIRSGEIGGPIKGSVWYSKGLLHSGSHLLNLLEFWFGPYISAGLISDGHKTNDDDSEPDFIVEYKSAKFIFNSLSSEHFTHFSVDFMCPGGRLIYDFGGSYVKWQSVVRDSDSQSEGSLNRNGMKIRDSMRSYQANVVDGIMRHLRGIPTTLCTGDEGLDTLMSIRAIQNSRNNIKG